MRISTSYLAGFFDGEGCISIGKNRSGHFLAVIVAQNEPEVLREFQSRYGGSLCHVQNTVTMIYRWQAPSQKAQRCLEELYPHLRLKRERALLALAFRRTFDADVRGRLSWPSVLDLREMYKQELHALNRRGV